MVCDDSLLLCGQVHGSHDYIHVLADVFKLKCCHHCHNDERMALLLPKEGKGGGPHPLLLKISLTWSVKPQECFDVLTTTTPSLFSELAKTVVITVMLFSPAHSGPLSLHYYC